MAFPQNFIWGTATAAYQVEGAATADGRGASIWDTFSHTPGKTRGGDTGDVACDSYHRWREDIELMAAMHLNGYRFSVAWPRVCPQGDGTVNEKGLAWYEALVDALLAKGIDPCLTLYHWDLPQTLQDEGGWLNPATAEAFALYTAAVARRLKGKIKRYVTLNEIECAVWMGYGSGEHAPGYRLAEAAQFTAWRNMLYAHCLAAKIIREIDPAAAVGIATTGRVCYPATETPADIAAAREEMFALEDGAWGFTHTLALDPLCFGRWPQVKGKNLACCIAAVPQYQLAALPYGKPDFIGLNIYNGSCIRQGANGAEYVPYPSSAPHTAMKWPVTPACLEWGPRFIGERYGLPMYITENGAGCNDKIYLDGAVHDAERIDFLARYLQALRKGIAAGADVRGYYHWSLLDNFEWAAGYGERLGLVYVDYPTGTRTPKDSARWYADVVKTNGETLRF